MITVQGHDVITVQGHDMITVHGHDAVDPRQTPARMTACMAALRPLYLPPTPPPNAHSPDRLAASCSLRPPACLPLPPPLPPASVSPSAPLCLCRWLTHGRVSKPGRHRTQRRHQRVQPRRVEAAAVRDVQAGLRVEWGGVGWGAIGLG